MSDTKEQDEFEKALNAAAVPVPHYYCEDCWYSCPKTSEGCCNDSIPKDTCNCGADEKNEATATAKARVLALYTEARKDALTQSVTDEDVSSALNAYHAAEYDADLSVKLARVLDDYASRRIAGGTE